MVKFLDPVLRVSPPLHKQCISNEALDVRLAAIREAIASGEDPNELGGWKNPGVARPLHYALDDSVQHDYRQLKQNLPIVKLLLQEGADPRLPDLRPGRRSPIEELEAWFTAYNEGDYSKWAREDLELHPFYGAALQVMKRVAAELDAIDDLLGQQTSNTKSAYFRHWFDRLKFW